jgi:hypothetical protein
VRFTTRDKPDIDSIVELADEDMPLHGRVLCDSIIELTHDECSLRAACRRPRCAACTTATEPAAA